MRVVVVAGTRRRQKLKKTTYSSFIATGRNCRKRVFNRWSTGEVFGGSHRMYFTSLDVRAGWEAAVSLEEASARSWISSGITLEGRMIPLFLTTLALVLSSTSGRG
ncbi:hypothetical protein GDO81_013823 [Engystomops pustulosus]|uniref:Uncharacterized protein n=1 Tax=Engystomops pustulosus TaxID=76066 RepID=A0AAV7B5V4_ENGPU|nr:hypothetical protein GDO81_013823 [Engystomops pustulosus]